MRIPVLLALAATFAAAAIDLPAQGRGRRGQRPDAGNAPAEAPAAAPAAPADQKPKAYLAIVGGDVYLGTGQRLTGATVLLADDKIEAVGQNLSLPEGTKVLDAKGKTVSPGFVAVLGNGMGGGRSAPFADSVNPFDPEIKQGLAAGITAFLAGGPGSGNTPSGSNAVIKLAYGDVKGMVLQEDPVCGMSVPLSLADKEKFEDTVKKAREYLKAVEEFPKVKAADANAKEPTVPPGADKVVAILRGKAKLWVSLGGGGMNPFGGGRRGGAARATDLDGIRQALELSQLLGQGVVLQKPTSAWLCPDEIAATGSMVVLSPRDRLPADPTDPERTGSNLASAAMLAAAGVPVAVGRCGRSAREGRALATTTALKGSAVSISKGGVRRKTARSRASAVAMAPIGWMGSRSNQGGRAGPAQRARRARAVSASGVGSVGTRLAGSDRSRRSTASYCARTRWQRRQLPACARTRASTSGARVPSGKAASRRRARRCVTCPPARGLAAAGRGRAAAPRDPGEATSRRSRAGRPRARRSRCCSCPRRSAA